MRANLYTRIQFDTADKANTLLEFLENEGGVFVPVKYGGAEPVRKSFATNRKDVIKLLTGVPKRAAGAVYLGGATHGALAVIAWVKSHLAKWGFYLEESYILKSSEIVEYTNFIVSLCSRFPIEYGWAGPAEDWRAKHLRTDYDDQGRTLGTTKLGADLDDALSGIYWLTVFGPSLVKRLTVGAFSDLPVWKQINTAGGGKIIIVRESPFRPTLEERLRQDRKVVQAIGPEYFFDMSREGQPLVNLLDRESPLEKK